MSIPKEVMDDDPQQRRPVSSGFRCLKRDLPFLPETPSTDSPFLEDSAAIEQTGGEDQNV